MDFARAFRYVFEEPKWVDKLGTTTLLTLASAIPLLGLLPAAVLLGYVVDLVANYRAGSAHPLPRWERWNERLRHGVNVLVAGVLYNLPNLLLSCCLLTFSGAFRGNFLGSTLSLLMICCGLPLVVLYNFVAYSMLAVGILRYSRSHRSGEFYRFGDLLGIVRANAGLFFQWTVLSLLATVALSLFAVTCIGIVVPLALLVPVNGHLLAQLTSRLDTQRPARKR